VAAALLLSASWVPWAAGQPVNLPPVIKIVVPFTPGGGNDVIARLVASQLATRIKRTVIVENKPGAGTFIGAEYVAKSARDGSTLLCVSTSLVTAAATRPNPSIDVTRDVIPVAMISEGPLVIVSSIKSGIRTPADLMAAARAKPDGITNGTTGLGTIAHLSTELLNDSGKIQLKSIPYKGGAPAMNDILGGFVDVGVGYSAGPLLPQIAAQKMNLVAVMSLEPSAAFPGVPAMSSVIPGFESTVWYAIWAPAGTPAPIVDYLNHELNEVSKSKDIVDALSQEGSVPLAITPAEAQTKVRKSYAQWKDIATKKSIVAE
jgi:tripartite-type tricarboxylate transporter receptor subunit TctC